MNIARPGVPVITDPAVKASVPIIMGTDVTPAPPQNASPHIPTKNSETRSSSPSPSTSCRWHPSTRGSQPSTDRWDTCPREDGASAFRAIPRTPPGSSTSSSPAPPPMRTLRKQSQTGQTAPSSSEPREPRSPANPALPHESTADAETWKSRQRHKTAGLMNSQPSPVFRKPQRLSIFGKCRSAVKINLSRFRADRRFFRIRAAVTKIEFSDF